LPHRDAHRLQRARELRTDLTATEQLLWSRLRRRQVAGCKFRRQQVLGPYIVDFACLEEKLVIELDAVLQVIADELGRPPPGLRPTSPTRRT